MTNSEIISTVARGVRKLMAKKGITRVDCLHELTPQISRATLYRCLSHESKHVPKLDVLIHIAAALDATVVDLFVAGGFEALKFESEHVQMTTAIDINIKGRVPIDIAHELYDVAKFHIPTLQSNG